MLTAIKNVVIAIYVAAIGVGVALLLLPPDVLARLGVHEITPMFRILIGGALGVSIGGSVAGVAYRIGKFSKDAMLEWRLSRNVLHTLHELSEGEKEFLREFIDNKQDAVAAAICCETALRLRDKAIIYQTSHLIAPDQRVYYGLETSIRKLLNKRRSLLAARAGPRVGDG